jgi:hypothetical protein
MYIRKASPCRCNRSTRLGGAVKVAAAFPGVAGVSDIVRCDEFFDGGEVALR